MSLNGPLHGDAAKCAIDSEPSGACWWSSASPHERMPATAAGRGISSIPVSRRADASPPMTMGPGTGSCCGHRFGGRAEGMWSFALRVPSEQTGQRHGEGYWRRPGIWGSSSPGRLLPTNAATGSWATRRRTARRRTARTTWRGEASGEDGGRRATRWRRWRPEPGAAPGPGGRRANPARRRRAA